MTNMNFGDAEPQRGNFDLMPDNTTAVVVVTVRPGGAGEGGWLKPSSNGSAAMLDLEFIIDGGEFDRRKVWGYWLTEGETDGQQKAARITRSRIRAALESARGVSPGDESKKAMEARQIAGWGDLDGLRFMARIGVEKSKDPQYSDKNVVKAAVTPDEDDYALDGSAPATTAHKPAATGGAKKPSWAG